jgi:hypothetical protein
VKSKTILIAKKGLLDFATDLAMLGGATPLSRI